MSRNDLTDPAHQLPEILAFEDRVLDEDLDVLEAYADMAVSTDLRVEISTAPTGSALPIGGSSANSSLTHSRLTSRPP